MTKHSYVTVTDQFCGAGGSSLGATAAGAELVLALNHWQLAIETHNTNFPDALHDCTDISACDPRRYPRTDILITSPECTNHSLAKGQKRYRRDAVSTRPMFEGYGLDPAAERSRATMWDVPRFAEFHDYEIIITENVCDARDWRMWDSWIHAMTVSLDYDYECVYFNSQFAHPTPQSRDRMYVVFWKRGNRRPNLRFTPLAWCATCGRDVAAVQSWKRPTMPQGKYERQYSYCCPVCAAVIRPYYYCAANAIDWTIPAPRISDRKQPLKDNTLARIEAGLKKFAGAPCLVDLAYSYGEPDRAYPAIGPYPTQTGAQTLGLLVETAYSHAPQDRTRPVTAPFLVRLTGKAGEPNGLRVPTEPLGTQVAAGSQHALVSPPPFIVEMYGTSTARAITAPLGTQTAEGNHHAVCAPPPFITSYYGTDTGHAITEALGTVPTVDRHALVTPTALPAVEECGFRILQPHEVGRAMAFPDDYQVLGTQRDKVKQYGNAVTPPTMAMLMERCLATLS